MARNKITIQDIADSANVSKSTVSRVLNDNTPVNEEKKKAVLEAMKRLDYRPNVLARSLAGGNSFTLGIVTQNIGSPFYGSVNQGVTMSLSGTGYSPIFADGQWEAELERASLETLIDRNVDGVIMVGGSLDRQAVESVCGDTPVVFVARSVSGWEERSVSIDNIAAGKEVTKHLIDAGHQRIAHVMGIDSHQDAQDRLEGYKLALSESSIDFDSNLIAQGDFSSQSGLLAVESLLLRSKSFTAIFCSNDEMALGARLGLYRKGIRVPEDISIVGFDDQPASAFLTPPLTTVAQPAIEMGKAGAEMLLKLLKNQPIEAPKLYASLVVRESVRYINVG